MKTLSAPTAVRSGREEIFTRLEGERVFTRLEGERVGMYFSRTV
jgi:hypothetical protein